jgi:putative transposase
LAGFDESILKSLNMFPVRHCEAFVKTFKRDYVRVNSRPDALAILRQLPAWFEDYNAVHPHSGLRMLSPRAFIAQQSATQAACPV